MPTDIDEEKIQQAIESEFQCHRCGNCCKGDGVVKFGRREAGRMAKHLGMSRTAFIERYAVSVAPATWWLRDQDNEEQWCIFLRRDADGLYGCEVNEAKPDQCGSFPARWRNGDSYEDCAGLRALIERLEKSNESDE